MALPVMATKLYVPGLRQGLVARRRLRELLRRGDESRLTLVSAPAGFGKTTLVTQWLRGTPDAERAVAWLSLDAADDEPVAFWTGVLTALDRAVPGVASAAPELVASSPRPLEPLLTTVVNELAAATTPVWLVLDDYHVIADREIREGMVFFLAHLPRHVHVVLSTRADPDLPLSRWRVRGELVEIRAAHLRFTPEEVAEYLNEVSALGLPPQDVTALADRTEGWIAALQLVALSLQGRDDPRDFVAHFTGNDRYVVDYLVEEVLGRQPEPVRGFLLESSVLDRFTGSLCDAVTGRADGSAVLTALERANLFLVALDDRREWYRYHHLFADVLRARLLAERPELVPVLHRRASEWFERHDLLEEAVRHAFAARDVDLAARLTELAVPAVRRHRREAQLLAWLKALPDDAVRRSPVLGVFYGYMLLVAGDLGAVEPRLADAERALAAVPAGTPAPWADTEELRRLPATIALYRAALAQARGDVAATADHARRAFEVADPADHLSRGGAAGLLGLAAWGRGDVSAALETFGQAVASLRAAGNLVDELSGTVVLADLELLAGRASSARELYRQALSTAEANGDAVARATAELHVGLGELDHEIGDLENARRHLETAAALGEREPATESRYRWFVAMSRVVEAEGDPRQALALLDTAAQLYRPGFFPAVRPIAAMKARVWIRRGDLAPATDWARQRGVSTGDAVAYLGEFDHLTLVRLLLARADPAGLADALPLLERLRDAAEASGRAGSLVEIRMLTALVLDAQGRRPQALQALDQAWAQAPEPDAHVRLFLDEGTPMVALLRAAEHEGVGSGHARRLLHSDPEADADLAGAGRRATRPAVESLSAREMQVLRLLDSELTGPEIARQLFVSPNTLRTHTKHIFTKLDVTSRRAAVRRARERGLM